MVREDGKRNFVMLENGEKTKQFTGRMPRQAALKAARRLEGYDSYESEDEAEALQGLDGEQSETAATAQGAAA